MALENPITITLAAPGLDRALKAMYPAFGTERFNIVALPGSWDALQTSLRAQPSELLVLEAEIAPDPQALVEFLESVNAAVFVVLPAAWQMQQSRLQQVGAVKEVFVGPVDYRVLADRAAAAAMSQRALRRDVTAYGAGVGSLHAALPSIVGTRIIAVVGKGGAGKSTIASNLAEQLALAGIRTLIVDLDSPGALPAYFDLSPSPSAMTFFANPGLAGLRTSVQKRGGLDILLGPYDGLTAAEIALRSPQTEGSVYHLIQTAAADGYAGIILDIPADPKSEFGLQALMLTNTLLLVARPTLVDQVWAISTHQLLTEQLAGKHNIPRERMFLVLNEVAPQVDNLTPSQFYAGISEHLREQKRGPFPPLLAVLPMDPAVRNAQNKGQLPLTSPETSDEYRRGIRVLADSLYPGAAEQKIDPNAGKHTLNLGLVKVRV
ncbi:MAG TPA: AAA family ATPase [Anaerolineae bacterium]|nr:AAA family ATPase [Anaerolineae bacterium]